MKRILVTGAAGFIGFHLARALCQRGDFVLGLDNFNAYYNPLLKEARAHLLRQRGIELVKGDIQNKDLLLELLDAHQITHIAHLAAQAGVRHSLNAPEEYISSNIQGFLSILEACRAHSHIKLIYASSSSVYGLNQKIPFSVEDKTERPANLYGSTKKANELMAHAYHHLYGISVTALRFFTAYGPWGRPDMAYYRFADQISEGKPIQVFGQGQMERDFTYIDDIIRGTIAAIDLGAPCEVFNLGNHRPVKLLYLIELLEKALGQKAIMQMLPMQSGEVTHTFADIEKSTQFLNFHPTVPIEEGIPLFIDWFLSQKSKELIYPIS